MGPQKAPIRPTRVSGVVYARGGFEEADSWQSNNIKGS